MRFMRNARPKSESGAVIVMVAVWLPVLALFVSFAVDFAHFFDYSRNLQNRADAAALAAGTQFGGTCFGTQTTGQTDVLGETAQQFSGPPDTTPDANLPFPFTNPVAPPYRNQPNLTQGTPGNFHLLLNSTANYPTGTNWSMAAAGGAQDSTAICKSTDEDGNTGPMVDVRVTQANLGLFFPLLGLTPTISAHARVVLQGAGGTNSVPIAVPDPAQTPCLRAEVINDTTGALVNDTNGNPIDVALTPPDLTATPPQPFWTVTLPAMNVPAAQLSVQAYIPDDCNNPGYPTGGTLYDSGTSGTTVVATHGLAYINTFANYTLPVTAPTVGKVFLTKGGCTDAGESAQQDAYFYYFPKSTTCTVVVHAQADFQSGAGPNPQFWAEMDGNNPTKMLADSPATDGAGRHFWTASFQVSSESGRHTFQILSSTANGSNPQKTAFNGGNPLQATFSAFSDGTVPPDDSGPITQAFVGDTSGAVDNDSLQRGTQQTLTVAFRLQGLELSGPNDPPIILRTGVQNRKATGAFDCGQGTGAQPLHDAIVNGCPDPVSIYQPAQGCVFLPTTPLTCANLVPGNRRNQVDQAFQDRVESAVCNLSTCAQQGKSSPCDMWQTFKTGTPISGFEPWNPSVPDSRIIVMVVTEPTDLSGGGGPVNSVKILGFAAFYITGFDNDPWLPQGKKGGTKIPNCSAPTDQDEPYPGSGSSNNQIWGHFIKYVALGGTPNGQPCDPNDVTVCVAALTR